MSICTHIIYLSSSTAIIILYTYKYILYLNRKLNFLLHHCNIICFFFFAFFIYIYLFFFCCRFLICHYKYLLRVVVQQRVHHPVCIRPNFLKVIIYCRKVSDITYIYSLCLSCMYFVSYTT